VDTYTQQNVVMTWGTGGLFRLRLDTRTCEVCTRFVLTSGTINPSANPADADSLESVLNLLLESQGVPGVCPCWTVWCGRIGWCGVCPPPPGLQCPLRDRCLSRRRALLSTLCVTVSPSRCHPHIHTPLPPPPLRQMASWLPVPWVSTPVTSRGT
jgi:hypothetical protein